MTGLRVWLHPSSRTVKLSLVIRRWSFAVGHSPFRFCQRPTTSGQRRFLHSTSFWRTASVVRNRSHVANGTHFDSRSRQRANRRLAARSRATDAHIDTAHTVIPRHVSGVRRSLLRRKRRAFARSTEAERSRTLPRQNVAIHVGDGHDRVIEGCLYIAQSMGNMLALLLFEGFLLAFFIRCGCCATRCCWFSHLKPSSVVGRW